MPDDVNSINKASSACRLTQEFNDLQNEIAGRDVGRNSRFLSANSEHLRGNGKYGRKTSSLTTLDLLMQDAVYQEAYQQTYSALIDTEVLLHDALVQSQERLNEVRKAWRDAKDAGANAGELKKLKQAVTDAKNQHDILLGYDSELQDIRDHMQDKDNPPSQAELDEYQKRIDEINKHFAQQHEITNTVKQDNDTVPTGIASLDTKPII